MTMTYGLGLNGAPEICVLGEIASDGAIITAQKNGWTVPVSNSTTKVYQTIQPASGDYAGGTYWMTTTLVAGAVTGVTGWVKQ